MRLKKKHLWNKSCKKMMTTRVSHDNRENNHVDMLTWDSWWDIILFLNFLFTVWVMIWKRQIFCSISSLVSFKINRSLCCFPHFLSSCSEKLQSCRHCYFLGSFGPFGHNYIHSVHISLSSKIYRQMISSRFFIVSKNKLTFSV